jgi:hypothetical protein
MKKLLVALSFMAVLVFMGTPSMALVGTPDAVPGTHVLQPFFLVSMDGQLDCLSVVYDVKGYAGSVHVTMWDRKSQHVRNRDIPYTPRGTVSLSIKAWIDTLPPLPPNPNPDAPTTAREQLIVDLNSDGVYDHYMGYLTFENSNAWDPNDDTWRTTLIDQFDNLVGKMYLVELIDGKAAGANIPAREVAYRNRFTPFGGWPTPGGGVTNPPGWWWWQNSRLLFPYEGLLPETQNLFTDYEVWTAPAYAVSKARENNYNPYFSLIDDTDPNPDPVIAFPAYLRLLPRFYLFNDNAENVIFVWSSANMGSIELIGNHNPDSWLRTCDIIREDEVAESITINLPHELNYINIATVLSGLWTAPVGGWVDIRFDVTWANLPGVWPDTFDDWIDVFPQVKSLVPLFAEWLAYSYQTASNADASLNWGVLYDSHRDIGTFLNLLDL